jgi:Noc2p family
MQTVFCFLHAPFLLLYGEHQALSSVQQCAACLCGLCGPAAQQVPTCTHASIPHLHPQTLNCLELWARVLGAAPKGGGLAPLVYPLVQLLLGTARLVPTPRYFPIRLRLVRALNKLAQVRILVYYGRRQGITRGLVGVTSNEGGIADTQLVR